MSDDADYTRMKETVMQVVTRHFRPEFINRIDEIVVFHALQQSQIRAITEIQIERIAERLKDLEIEIDVTTAAKDFLGMAGYDPVYGARPLKRAIQNYLETPLAKEILSGNYGPGDRITIDSGDQGLILSHTKASAA